MSNKDLNNQEENIKKDKYDGLTKKEISEKRKDFWAMVVVVASLVIVAFGVILSIVFTSMEIASGEGIPGLPTLKLSISVFISTLIALAIVFALTYHLFWDKLKTHLEVRQQNITTNIAAAQYKNAEAAKHLEVATKEVKTSRKEAKTIVDDSRKEALKVKREIKEEAKVESDNMLVRTREQIEREKIAMEADIRKEILETSILAAEKIIEKELDGESNKKMIEELIENLK